jgi:5-methylcytosine-specific restriction endonuclease McrA
MRRPCIGCGELIDSGSRCAECQPRYRPKLTPAERGYDHKWRTLSADIRRTHRACELCGSTHRLQVDHIITIEEDPTLRLARENLRVLCQTHNANRPPATDEEREAVYAAVRRRQIRVSAYPIAEVAGRRDSPDTTRNGRWAD